MKTLYISDLDGTLLTPEQTLSKYTIDIIKALSGKAVFSYATARSLYTASKVTAQLNIGLQVAVYNGAFIVNSKTKEILLSVFFTAESLSFIADILQNHGILPIVYSYISGTEKFSWLRGHINTGMNHFLTSRKDDERRRPLRESSELYAGSPFYLTCIDDEKKLFPVYKLLKSDKRYNCVYQKDIYGGGQWLEILPAEANKANAALRLKGLLRCDRIVSFGDGKNDMALFKISDECYAVENAVSDLKEIATGVIGSSSADGVAKFLAERFL